MRPLHVVIFVFGFFHFCHGRRLVSPQTRPSRSGKATTITSSLNQNVALVSEDERKTFTTDGEYDLSHLSLTSRTLIFNNFISSVTDV